MNVLWREVNLPWEDELYKIIWQCLYPLRLKQFGVYVNIYIYIYIYIIWENVKIFVKKLFSLVPFLVHEEEGRR